MKKVLAIVLALVMVIGLAACGTPAPANTNTAGNENTAPAPSNDANNAANENTNTAEPEKVYNVGMVCIGNENMAYDRNFYMAAEAAEKILADKGIKIQWNYTYDHPEGQPVADDCEELAGEKECIAVFLNSYGMEPAMLGVAADYPDTVFIGMTNEGSMRDDLENTVNAFPSIYEARYLAGVAAGCKLNELIENKTITEDEAVIGYVGAYTFAEVVSGYTSFYLGAKSVCPSATMIVKFIGSWGDPTMEAATAQDLIDNGAVLISQHSDSTTPATTAQDNTIKDSDVKVAHVGYNISMSDVAPESSIISSRIDWTNYMVYVIETIVNGGKVDQDYIGHGLKDGDVCLTELNEKIAAEGTAEAIKKAEDDIVSGKLNVFDTSTFTVGGQTPTEALVDMDGDFKGDADYNAISDGYYHESYFKSAPAFDLQIDGIKLLNTDFGN